MSILLALVASAQPLCAAAAPAPADAPEKARDVPACVPGNGTDWRVAATRDDVVRMRGWRDAFIKALGEARAAGNGAEMTAQGALLEPDVALDDAALPMGVYRCRTIKLGTGGGGPLAYVAYPPFRCQVKTEYRRVVFEKLTGSQRPFGTIYAAGRQRQIFLGTVILGDETRALTYGRDAQRDQIGAVERIGPQRWRILFPYPRFESTLDVVELVPAS